MLLLLMPLLLLVPVWTLLLTCLCAAAAETQHFGSPFRSCSGCLSLLHDLQREEEHLCVCRQLISSRKPEDVFGLALPGRLKVTCGACGCAGSVG